jgi:hypothetical protein
MKLGGPLAAARTRPLLLAALVVAALTASAPSALAAPPAPSAQVLAPPAPVLGTDDRRHLVYEIKLDNTSDATVTVERLVVRDAVRRTALLSLGADVLPEQLIMLGTSGPTTLAPGETAFAFLDVPLPARGRVPSALTHRMTLSVQRPGRPSSLRTVELAPTRVGRRPAAVLSPPLRGQRFFAGDACCARGVHAHSLVPFDGQWLGAQRYAIDWIQLNEDLNSATDGNPTRNESYLVWGEHVLAVAPGTIVAARADLPDNNTPPLDPPEPALDELVGNQVVEDIGGGRFAVYAHLQQNGVAVHAGDRVRRGDVLGQVGNSGASSEPHLHFHLMDAAGGPSALAANALPFVFDSFRLDGAIRDLETGEVIPAPAPAVRHRQLPLTGDITDFGS